MKTQANIHSMADVGCEIFYQRTINIQKQLKIYTSIQVAIASYGLLLSVIYYLFKATTMTLGINDDVARGAYTIAIGIIGLVLLLSFFVRKVVCPDLSLSEQDRIDFEVNNKRLGKWWLPASEDIIESTLKQVKDSSHLGQHYDRLSKLERPLTNREVEFIYNCY
ncbi:hypothetical protein AB4254_11980 [Vibrio breoganii]